MSEQDHTHGPDCETVMAIRNTTIEEGVKLLTESNRKAVIKELEWLATKSERKFFSGGQTADIINVDRIDDRLFDLYQSEEPRKEAE